MYNVCNFSEQESSYDNEYGSDELSLTDDSSSNEDDNHIKLRYPLYKICSSYVLHGIF